VSIRLRLTLLYSVILALTLILFSSLLYAAHARSTMAIVERDLEENAAKVVLAWIRFHRDWNRSPLTDPSYATEAQRALQPLVREEIPRDAVHILDAHGDPLALPINEQTSRLPISDEGMGQLQAGHAWQEIAQGKNARWLAFNIPVITEESDVIGIVQIARSLADRDRSLKSLGLTLMIGSAAATVLAFGIGWFLAGTTLRPIQRITQTAQAIGESRDFSSRVTYQGPPDELGRLAMTFNAMLARLEDAYQQVAHALKVQRDFVADVSHELRTPLTTIRGNLALLQRDPPLPDEDRVDILEDLTEESGRLTRLVTDLLTLARADAGRQLALAPINVSEIVDDVCRQMQVVAPEYTWNVEHPKTATARANADALKQTLLILLDNAVKHGQDPITVSVEASDHHVTLAVQDSGPGMAPDLQARIFDRFYRGDSSRSTPGFGLGLAIAHALVEAQHGTLDLTSEPGVGSTFTVRLPGRHETT
jgi:signal transduction histidine kinase